MKENYELDRERKILEEWRSLEEEVKEIHNEKEILEEENREFQELVKRKKRGCFFLKKSNKDRKTDEKRGKSTKRD